MRKNSGVFEITQQFCKEDDRWVLIERALSGGIVGLNFMQGDDLKLFKEQYSKSNPELMKFFRIIQKHLYPNFYAGGNRDVQFNILNKIFWAFVEY
jgi:hypothetical protein